MTRWKSFKTTSITLPTSQVAMLSQSYVVASFIRRAARDVRIVSDVIRRNESQAWFVAEHVVSVPLTHAR